MSRDCGCGRPTAPVPAPTENRPGLPSLRYRAGTHATFLQALLEGISTVTVPHGDPPGVTEDRPLAGLTVRGTDDPSIAMLDAWATMADVLTFYQERIANEGYLRTATERRSLVELARLTGYRPRPGVAAGVHLAFDLDEGYELELPAGTRALSVPAPGETMQAFETTEALEARAKWNRLVPRATEPAVLLPADRQCELYLQGITTGLNPGDLLLLDFTTVRSAHRVTEVHPDALLDRTRVVLDCPPQDDGTQPSEETVEFTESGVPVAYSLEAAQPAPAVISTDEVAAILEHAAGLVAKSKVKNSAAAARSLTDEAARVRALGDTIAIDDGEQALGVLASAAQSVAGPNASLDQQLQQAQDELSALVYSAPQGSFSGDTQASFASVAAPASYQPSAEYYGGGPASTSAYAPAATATSTTTPGGGIIAQKEDTTGLSTVLKNTRVYAQPSVPPTSAVQLGRTHTDALAAGGAVAPSLLAVFNPTLGANLFRAWSGIRVPLSNQLGTVYAFRVKAAPFGANAPPAVGINDNCQGETYEWPLDECDSVTGTTDRLTLNAVYDRILPGSWVAVRSASRLETDFYRALQVETVARRSYGMGARATQLTLDDVWLRCQPETPGTSYPTPTLEVLRDLTVYAQAEALALARRPVTDDVEGDEIELDALYDGLTPGRWIIVSGERTDLDGVTAAELAMIAGVRHAVSRITLGGKSMPLPGDHVHTWITLSAPLSFTYKRETVQIYGNVAAATHGETREQVLGSGDGSKALQRFELMQGPLTYVPAPTPSGVETTLAVRVEKVKWDEAPHLAAMGPRSRAYVVRTDHEDKTSVTFGDGVRGARLPTGHENVTAVYRTGIGAPGNVDAGQISLLATRPAGLKSVVNPLASSGGGDPDTAEQIRRNAPLGLLSLERIVSVEDYTDFVRAFAGIGKAQAAFLTDGRRPVVHVTIAGVDDEPIGENSLLLQNLVAALRRYGDPHRYLTGGMRDLRTLVVSARVMVRSDVLWEDVEPLARAALLDHFGFAKRELGQGVAASEVVGVLQGVWGVAAVDLDLLAAVGEDELREDPDALAEILEKAKEHEGWVHMEWIPSYTARLETESGGGRRIRPAQLLVLTPEVPETLILTEWKP